jgi:hypothetical protein
MRVIHGVTKQTFKEVHVWMAEFLTPQKSKLGCKKLTSMAACSPAAML